jgi:hypothetical protein
MIIVLIIIITIQIQTTGEHFYNTVYMQHTVTMKDIEMNHTVNRKEK